MREQVKEVEAMTEGDIPESYRQRSRETAADIINAFVTGEKFVDVGNLPNVGQVSNLPRGPVLETPVLASPTGFHPIAIGPLPEPARTWVERSARVEDMVVEAALSGDFEQALAALLLDPLVSHLNVDQVREMGLRLLHANARYLQQFEGKI